MCFSCAGLLCSADTRFSRVCFSLIQRVWFIFTGWFTIINHFQKVLVNVFIAYRGSFTLQDIQDRILELEDRVSSGEVKVQKLETRVESQEHHSRQLNLRVYGYKAKDEMGAFRDAKPLFAQLLTDGLKIPQAQAERIHPTRIHWAGKGAYMIIAFDSATNLSLVKSKRTELANYKPDGSSISLRDDFTLQQQPMVQLVDKIVSALRKSKVKVASAGLFVRHEKCNYKPDDPHIQGLLQQHSITITQEPVTYTRVTVS